MTESKDLAARYKRTVASRYRALKSDELGEIPSGTVRLSPKIDGELWVAILEGGKASLVAPGNRTLTDAPVLTELAAAAKRASGRTVLAGELFAVGGKPRPRVGDVNAALAEGGKALDKLGWQAFDAIEVDGAPAPLDYGERLAVLEKLLAGGKRAAAIKTVTTADRAEIEAQWREWGESGKAEGMVVRAEDGRIFKVKPGFSLDAVIVGFTTRAEATNQIRSLLLALMRPDGTFQLVSGVGNVGSEATRRELLSKLTPIECPSAFRHTSGDGSLVRWVKPTVVVEVTCTDAQGEDAAGDPISRWALQHGSSGWSPIAPMPGGSLLHPSLVRVRTDKSVNDVDVRVAQLSERFPLPELDKRAEAIALPKSVVTRREVWTKEAKGKTAVRKLVVWQTNKQDRVEGWPAWVVHFTDYSPDRKTPLERTVKTALNKVEADGIAGALVAENIKKGWEPAGASYSSAAASAPEAHGESEGDEPKKPAKKAAKADEADAADSETSAETPKKRAMKKAAKTK